MYNIVDHLIGTAIECLIGWLLIVKVPAWLGIRGTFATIVKVIGVLFILHGLLSWV